MKTLFTTLIIILTFNLNVCANFHRVSEIENVFNSNKRTQTLEYYINIYIENYGFDGFTSLLEDIKNEKFCIEGKSYKDVDYIIYIIHTNFLVSFINENNQLYIIEVVPKDEIIVERYVSDNIYDLKHGRLIFTERSFKLYRRDRHGWSVASFDNINKIYTHHKDKINNPQVKVFNTNKSRSPDHYVIVGDDKVEIRISEMLRTTKNNKDFLIYEYRTFYTLTPCIKIKGNYNIKVNKVLRTE